MEILITEEEGFSLLSSFLDSYSSDDILLREKIIQKYKEPKSLKFTWFGFTDEHIHDINPFYSLSKITDEDKNEIYFGFKNGLFFLKNKFFFTKFEVEEKFIHTLPVGPIPLEEFVDITFGKFNRKNETYYKLYLKEYKEIQQRNYSENEIQLLEKLKNIITDFVDKKRSEEDELRNKIEQQRLNRLGLQKNTIVSELDKDNDGQVDLVDIESLNKLLTKNQKTIIDIDKIYIQKFVKISLYLKTKRSNTQKIFDSLNNSGNEEELNELIRLLKNQVYTYDLLVFHSISMVTSLVDSDLITFYEIYECFDQLGVFNSNWENEVSSKLTDIGDGIKELMYTIHEMENRIVDSIENLTYVTQNSFTDLQGSITKQLSDIDSGIQINNLLTGIQTYQMYRINQNTKRVN
jgi:hypothetical protein